MKPWEVEYVNAHILVAHSHFRSSRCHQMAQLALWAEVSSIMVVVHPHHCGSCLTVAFSTCQVGKEGSGPLAFRETVAGWLWIAIFIPFWTANTTPKFISSHTSEQTLLIICCIPSLATRHSAPLASLDITNAWLMSACSCCSWPPCLAIVANMLKTY